MRRMLVISFIISASMLSIFALNIVLYAMVPAYRNALLMSVSGINMDIPVIEATGEVVGDGLAIAGDITDSLDTFEEEGAPEIRNIGEVAIPLTVAPETEDVSYTEAAEPQIIERTYYEDCGTGEGYWVIKYSDGTTKVE